MFILSKALDNLLYIGIITNRKVKNLYLMELKMKFMKFYIPLLLFFSFQSFMTYSCEINHSSNIDNLDEILNQAYADYKENLIKIYSEWSKEEFIVWIIENSPIKDAEKYLNEEILEPNGDFLSGEQKAKIKLDFRKKLNEINSKFIKNKNLTDVFKEMEKLIQQKTISSKREELYNRFLKAQVHKNVIECAKCKKTKKLKKCARCKIVYYCSAECQKSHWKTHKPTCLSNTGAGSTNYSVSDSADSKK